MEASIVSGAGVEARAPEPGTSIRNREPLVTSHLLFVPREVAGVVFFGAPSASPLCVLPFSYFETPFIWRIIQSFFSFLFRRYTPRSFW